MANVEKPQIQYFFGTENLKLKFDNKKLNE